MTTWNILAAAVLFAALLPAQVKLPPFTRDTLSNGTVVLLSPQSGLPLVHFRVLVKGGMESEPAGQAGIAGVAAELLRRGAGTRTSDEFAEELDRLGGTFETGVDEQSTFVRAEFLRKDFDRGLALLADAILRPAFSEAEVRKTLAQSLDSVRSARDFPEQAIGFYWRSFFYGTAHPYGHPPAEPSLEAITRQNILDYHKRQYAGRNFIVIVTGDFDAPAARARVQSAFGAAPAGEAWPWTKAASPAAVKGPRLLLVDKADATQTYFHIGRPGIDRRDPDRFALTLVNTLFGGRFTSMLNDELRVNSGLTYGAHSVVERNRLPGAIYMASFTRTDTTAKAVDIALDVLTRLREKGIDAEQLASAKAYVKGTYPPRALETMDQIAAMLGQLEIFGLGRDEVDEYFARLDGVTTEQANAVARRHYRNDDLTFVLVGSADRIRDSVRKYAPALVERPNSEPGWGVPPRAN